jgi:hypothetical protein
LATNRKVTPPSLVYTPVEATSLNLVTGLMYVLGPLTLTTAFGIAGRALGQGLTSFTTFRVTTPVGGVG